MMAGESDCPEATDQRGGQSKNADFQGDLYGGGKSQRNESADAKKVDVDRGLASGDTGSR